MYIDYLNCQVGMLVYDRSYGKGYIREILKTRIKVRFDKNAYDVTYDKPHIKICLERYEEN